MSSVTSAVVGEQFLAPAQPVVSTAVETTSGNYGPQTGTIAASTSGTNGTGFYTQNTNDIVYCVVVTNGIAVSSVAGGGLTWTKRATAYYSTTLRMESWTAPSASALTNQTMTVTIASSGNAAFMIFGVKNGYYSAPYDFSALTTISGSGTGLTTTFSATDPTICAIAMYGWIGGSGASWTHGNIAGSASTDLGSIDQGTNLGLGCEFVTLSALASSQTALATLGASETYVGIVDAIMCNASNVYALSATSTQEWIIHNLYFSGACSIAKFNGVNEMSIYATPIMSGRDENVHNHLTTSTANIVFVNASTTNGVTIGWDGMRSI